MSVAISDEIAETYDGAYDDGKHDAYQNVGYLLPRFVTGINPDAHCPACMNAIGMGLNCPICKGAWEVMRASK